MENGGRTLPAVIAACSLATIVISVISPVRAADSSAWSRDSHSAFRLSAGSNAAGATALRAGIEIKLDPGWHTYWRYPGDSGVPPRFDFARSDNVRTVDVLWPAPQRFSDQDGNSIGYKGSVVLPLHIAPKDPAKPARLELKLDYAICEKLCVPAEATAALTVSGAATSYDALIAAAEEKVPVPVGENAAANRTGL